MTRSVPIFLMIILFQFFVIAFILFNVNFYATKKYCPSSTRNPLLIKNFRTDRLEHLSNYDQFKLERLDALIARKADSRDPELIALTLELMDPPAVSHSLKLSRLVYKTPQVEVVDSFLQGQTGGFFVEVGGFDGERSSNTLFLEAKKGWNGLLIEADPLFYLQLLGKNRRCWSINACLSPTRYASKLSFHGSDTGKGHLVLTDEQTPGKMNSAEGKISFFDKEMVVPCFPLETLLLAINHTRVDFFSLDVEGVELDILQSLDFQRLDIKTLAVEYAHGNKGAYIPFMKEKGYSLIKEIRVTDFVNFLFAEDFIFAKNT